MGKKESKIAILEAEAKVAFRKEMEQADRVDLLEAENKALKEIIFHLNKSLSIILENLE